jgi:hypothetical protein
MGKFRIQFTLFSAFDSPLIATMSGGFLIGSLRSGRTNCDRVGPTQGPDITR